MSLRRRLLLVLLISAVSAFARVRLSGNTPHSKPVSVKQWCIMIPPDAPPLPRSVVHAVMDSKQGVPAKKWFREQGKDPYKLAPLEGMRVHLNHADGPTYLVGGMWPGMTGGDNRWYWFVQRSGNQVKILLYVHTGCVHLSTRKTLGYANIETEWQAAGYRVIREYRWNGHSYRLRRQRREEFK